MRIRQPFTNDMMIGQPKRPYQDNAITWHGRDPMTDAGCMSQMASLTAGLFVRANRFQA